MPKQVLMSWEGRPHFRWVKMYQGTRYRVSCDELNRPKTKDASVEAANAWWNQKRVSLESASFPYPARLDQLEQRKAYAKRHGMTKEVFAIEDEIRKLRNVEVLDSQPVEDAPLSETARATIETLVSNGLINGERLEGLGSDAMESLFGDARLWSERLGKEKESSKDRTIGMLSDQYVKEIQAEAIAGG